MLEGTFVTITGFGHYRDKEPFSIGSVLLCCKEPDNPYDTEAIKVLAAGGAKVGYITNGTGTKANGTMSAARLYDRVGERFSIEVCFSTKSKIICQIINFDVQDEETINHFSYTADEYDYDDDDYDEDEEEY